VNTSDQSISAVKTIKSGSRPLYVAVAVGLLLCGGCSGVNPSEHQRADAARYWRDREAANPDYPEASEMAGQLNELIHAK